MLQYSLRSRVFDLRSLAFSVVLENLYTLSCAIGLPHRTRLIDYAGDGRNTRKNYNRPSFFGSLLTRTSNKSFPVFSGRIRYLYDARKLKDTEGPGPLFRL